MRHYPNKKNLAFPAVIVIRFHLFDFTNIDNYQAKQDFIAKDLSIEVLFIFL